MKGILFINGYSGPDLALKEQVLSSGLHVEVIDVMTQDNPFKQYVRATPALFTFRDDMQGEFLCQSDVDVLTLIEASLLEEQDREERNVHGQDNARLDKYIKQKQDEAADALTEDLLERGVI